MDIDSDDGQSPLPHRSLTEPFCNQSWGSPGTARRTRLWHQPLRTCRDHTCPQCPVGWVVFSSGVAQHGHGRAGCWGRTAGGISGILGWRERNLLRSLAAGSGVFEAAGCHQRRPHRLRQAQRPPLPALPLLGTEPFHGSPFSLFSIKSLPQPSVRSPASVSPRQCLLLGVFKGQGGVMWSG